MDLNTIWFILIAVLFVGFFFLEGFDYGVGILLPVLGKSDRERRTIINTIGPFWDGNEVWLITAGGAMFAAFPHWYATLFSGFYMALVLMLLALIVRGVAFEFRSKRDDRLWRGLWDAAVFVGSLVPALLWGIAVGNWLLGVPIDASMNYVGDFTGLLNPFALLAGLTFLLLFALHGSVFLSLKTEGDIRDRARRAASFLWLPTLGLVALVMIAGFLTSVVLASAGWATILAAALAVLALLAVGWMVRSGKEGWSFVMTGFTIALLTATIFTGLFPRTLVSSLNPEWSLTIYNSSSSPYTLGVMAIVALIFVPIVLLYQGWSYWVFRKRVGSTQTLEY